MAFTKSLQSSGKRIVRERRWAVYLVDPLIEQKVHYTFVGRTRGVVIRSIPACLNLLDSGNPLG